MFNAKVLLVLTKVIGWIAIIFSGLSFLASFFITASENYKDAFEAAGALIGAWVLIVILGGGLYLLMGICNKYLSK